MGNLSFALCNLGRISAHAAGRVGDGGGGECEIEADGRQFGERRSRIVLGCFGDKRIGDAEDGIGIDVLVGAEVERGDEFAVTVATDHEMDVGGAVAVPRLGADHVADWAIHGNQVAEGTDGAEVVIALGIGVVPAAQVHHGGVAPLQVVDAFVVGLPDLD